MIVAVTVKGPSGAGVPTETVGVVTSVMYGALMLLLLPGVGRLISHVPSPSMLRAYEMSVGSAGKSISSTLVKTPEAPTW